MEFNTVLLATLLRGVSGFIEMGQSTEVTTNRANPPESMARFMDSRKGFLAPLCDYDVLRNLVLKDGRMNSCLARILSKAEQYALSQHGHSSLEFRTNSVPVLYNCFAGLRLEKPVPAPEIYEPSDLAYGNVFSRATPAISVETLIEHKKAFEDAFDRLISQLVGMPMGVVLPHLWALIHRFAWCIPGSTMQGAMGISLYDRLRTSCALTSSLYRYHSQNKMDLEYIENDETMKLRLVAGDLSGIQSYIFGFSGTAGIAKRLRARSFYLSILAEAISHIILHNFRLPWENVIASSGGHFYVLLPNNGDSEKWVERMQRQLDLWALERFGGEVRVNLAQLSLSGEDFASFGTVLERIGMLMAEGKARPLASALTNQSGWATEKFCRPIPREAMGYCAVCGRNLVSANSGEALECDACKIDHRLGTRLVKAKYVAFHRGATAGGNLYPLFGEYAFELTNHPSTVGKSAYLFLKPNDNDLSDLIAYPAASRYLAGYVPLAGADECAQCLRHCGEPPPNEGEPLYFDCLAARAKGRKVLGYLKADVDNLGSLLLVGMRGETGDGMNVSRLAMVSRMLDQFFSGWVHHLMETRFPDCYTVFSGGDDLFVIGPWDQAIQLASTIKEDFERFTNRNENITLSAGVAFAKPRTPVTRCTVLAEEALGKSKDHPARGHEEGRNQITLLGETVKWAWFAKLVESGKYLGKWQSQWGISTAFLYRLKRYGQMYQEYLDNGCVESLKFIPLMTYDIARNLPDVGDSDPNKSALRQWAEALKIRMGPEGEMAYLPFIVDYVLMSKE